MSEDKPQSPPEWNIEPLASVLRGGQQLDSSTGREAAFTLYEMELSVDYLRADDDRRYVFVQELLKKHRSASFSDSKTDPSEYVKSLTELRAHLHKGE